MVDSSTSSRMLALKWWVGRQQRGAVISLKDVFCFMGILALVTRFARQNAGGPLECRCGQCGIRGARKMVAC
jgi:hypothetical protein